MASEQDLHVLVALDNASPNERALRTLALLRSYASLELTCLFVEDEDLLRAASLPGLREISLSGQALHLDAARIEKEMADAAASARRTFDAVALRLAQEHQRLHHRFLVARGRSTEEIDRAARQSDVVMVTRAMRPSGLRARQGRAFLTLLRQPKPVLFVNEPWDSGTSLVVLDGSATDLETAARLAAAEKLRLVVATTAASDIGDQLPAAAERRHLAAWDEESIARLCLAEDARLLVAPARTDVNWAELLGSLMDKLPCSLLKLAE